MSQHEALNAVLADSSFEIHLRALRRSDVEQVKAIELSWPLLSHWDIAVYDRVARLTENAQGIVAIERRGDEQEKVVGFVVYRVTIPETEILNIAVDPVCIRKQIGSRLLQYVERLVVAQGVKNLFLEVRPSNAPAREFYFKRGFTEVGRRKEYYAQPIEDAILMKRTIHT